MFTRNTKPDTPDRTRQQNLNLHVTACETRSNPAAVKDAKGPLTPEQRKFVEDMEWVQVSLGSDSGSKLEVPDVVFHEAFRYGPPAAGAPPRHPRYEDMLAAGTAAVARAAKTFNPEFGDGKMNLAKYARCAVRRAIVEQLNDRLVHVPRKRLKDWPKEELVPVELREGSTAPTRGLRESPTRTRSRWREEFERAREPELRVPTQETIAALEVWQETELVLRYEWVDKVLSVWGLTPRERRALVLRYGLNGANLTFAEVGEEMEISAQRARQLVRNGERKLEKTSPEQKEELLPLLTRNQYYRRSLDGARRRPAWEDDVLDLIGRDPAENRKREDEERSRLEAWFKAARNQPVERRRFEDTTELKQVA
jgi:RNA polymerase sigma factor (sigma-70 family)